MNIILAFLAFNVIIIVHELGHFIAAKLSHIKVNEFSMFVGPKLFGFERGGTVYSLRLFPILAYVKMEGEDEAAVSEMSYNRKPPWVRAVVALAGPMANLLFALLVLLVVFSISGYNTTRINIVASESPAFEAGLKSGDVVTKYDGKKIYQPMDLIQFMYVGKGRHAGIEVYRDGEIMSLSIDPRHIPEQTRYLFGFAVKEPEGSQSNVIGEVFHGTPAETAGLLGDDRIIRLNETEISSKKNIDDFMATNGDKPVNVVVSRNGETFGFTVTPKLEKTSEQYYAGFDFAHERGNLFDIFRYSVGFTWSTVRSVAYTLVWLITGKVSVSQMMGPVGIVSTMSSVVQQSPTFGMVILNLMSITAFISTALGATNLIPFPALDGSKIVIALVEAVRKKPITPEREAFITMVGFVLLIALAVFTLYNDIVRVVGG